MTPFNHSFVLTWGYGSGKTRIRHCGNIAEASSHVSQMLTRFATRPTFAAQMFCQKLQKHFFRRAARNNIAAFCRAREQRRRTQLSRGKISQSWTFVRCRKHLSKGDVTLVNLQRQLAMIRCCAKNRSNVTPRCGRFFAIFAVLQRVGSFWKRFKSVTCLQIRAKNMRCESALQVDQCNFTLRRENAACDANPSAYVMSSKL